MPDKADERVIAEWLGYKWVVPKKQVLRSAGIHPTGR